MRRCAGLVVAVAALLALPASALAKTTPDITFKSDGSAATPSAVDFGQPGTFQDIPFTIAQDDTDGSASIAIHWDNQFDDFDLYVYKKNASGGLDQVGSSAGGPPSQDEATVVTATSGPLEPGSYVIRVQNYAASSPNFTGFAKFSAFVPANQLPIAALTVPTTASPGQAVTLDASGSRDPDGRIVDYAWDLDGNGSIETDGGASPTLVRTLTTGVHHVTVRVTDDKGARAYANKTVTVGAAGSAKPTPAAGKKNHRKSRKKHRHRR
ncbi:MAG: PKD domain-containing protein [Thermoleophilaceae bacterium]